MAPAQSVRALQGRLGRLRPLNFNPISGGLEIGSPYHTSGVTKPPNDSGRFR